MSRKSTQDDWIESRIERNACQADIESLAGEGVLKVLAGVTSLVEMIRVTTNIAIGK